MAGGRPTDYTSELAFLICERIGNGESVRKVCTADDMPSPRSVYRWLAEHEEFRQQYEKSTQERAEHLAEEAIEIADDGRNDWMERKSEAEKGAGWAAGWVANGEHVQRSRLRVDTRKWFVSKLAPKKYGEKITQEQTGPDGGPIQTVTSVVVTIVDPKTD